MRLIYFMLGIVTMGTMHTLLIKALDLHNVKGVAFMHPYIQALIMFLGELLCIVPYMLFFRQKDQESGAPFTSIPAMCDMMASILCNFGLIMTSAGTYQMLRGSVVIIVAFMSVTILKRKLSMQQVTGVCLVFFGVSLVGISSIQTAGKSSAIGIAILAGAMVIQATQNVYEEHLLKKYDFHPTMMVGCEGIVGATILFILLPILNAVHCSYFMCNHGHLENVGLALKQLASDHFVQTCVISTIACVGILNYCCVSVVKESGAISKCIIETLRILCVWLVSLAFRWEPFDGIQLVGFMFLVLGNILYNEILPWFKGKETKEKL